MVKQSPASGTALPALPQHGDEDGGSDPSHDRSGGAQVEAYHIGTPRVASGSPGGQERGAEKPGAAEGKATIDKLLCMLTGGRSDDIIPLDEIREALESLRPAANLMPAFTAAADRRGTDSAAGRASGSRS